MYLIFQIKSLAVYWALFAVNVERSVKNIQVGDFIIFSFNVLGSV